MNTADFIYLLILAIATAVSTATAFYYRQACKATVIEMINRSDVHADHIAGWERLDQLNQATIRTLNKHYDRVVDTNLRLYGVLDLTNETRAAQQRTIENLVNSHELVLNEMDNRNTELAMQILDATSLDTPLPFNVTDLAMKVPHLSLIDILDPEEFRD